MIATTIKLTTAANAIGVFLHYPDDSEPLPLPGVEAGWQDNLGVGIYAIAASGTGNPADTAIEFEIKTAVNTITRKRRVRSDGTLRAFITFEIDPAGKVS